MIEVRPDDAGAVFVCMACGTRNESPILEQDGTAWTAMRKAVEKDVQRWKKGANAPDATVVALEEAALEEAAAAVASTVRAAEAALKPPVSAQRPAKFGSPMAWAIGVALVTLAIVLPFVIAKWNEPKKADYSDLLAMQQKAESLAAAGDLPAAHEAYGVLFDKANERPVDDPLVLERLA
ncbi:MAG TPA: hypothetical protein VGP94_10530, partial [Tepidisphaeraceae bacterium]|nr:hypothetical protein [Tepidisphaeraceae bacterium]